MRKLDPYSVAELTKYAIRQELTLLQLQRHCVRLSQPDPAGAPIGRPQSVNFEYPYPGIENYPDTGMFLSPEITYGVQDYI